MLKNCLNGSAPGHILKVALVTLINSFKNKSTNKGETL